MTFFVDREPLTAPRRAGGDIQTGFGDYIGAVIDDMFASNPSNLPRQRELLEARGGTVEISGDEFDYDYTYIPNPSAPLSEEAQKERIEKAGLTAQIEPQKDYTPEALNIIIERKRSELARMDARDRAPWFYAPAGLIAGLGATAIDPLNVASAFVPVVGEARLVWMLGRAGGAWGRAGVRAGVGAIEGAAGAALVEPLVALGKYSEQAEYGMADAVMNIGFGAVFGSVLHAGGGAVGDAARARRGLLQPWEREVTPAPNLTAQDRQRLAGDLLGIEAKASLADMTPIEPRGLPVAETSGGKVLRKAGIELAESYRKRGPVTNDISGETVVIGREGITNTLPRGSEVSPEVARSMAALPQILRRMEIVSQDTGIVPLRIENEDYAAVVRLKRHRMDGREGWLYDGHVLRKAEPDESLPYFLARLQDEAEGLNPKPGATPGEARHIFAGTEATDRALASLSRAIDEAPQNAALREAYAELSPDDQYTVFRVAAMQAAEGRRIDVEGLIMGRADWLRRQADEALAAEAAIRKEIDGMRPGDGQEAVVPEAVREATERLDDSLEMLGRSNKELAENMRDLAAARMGEQQAVLDRIDLEERVLLEAADCEMRR